MSNQEVVAYQVRDYLSLAGVEVGDRLITSDSHPNCIFIYGDPLRKKNSRGIKHIYLNLRNDVILDFYEGQKVSLPIPFPSDERLIQNICRLVKDMIRAQLYNYTG